MRRFYSYGLALIIIVVIGLWMASGTLIVPGSGPGKGEIPIAQAIQGKNAEALEGTRLVKAETPEEQAHDPALSIAERQAVTTGAAVPPRSVRIATYTMQAMPVEVTLRGRTKANSQISVVPETSGTLKAVAVEKGQHVDAGDLLCTLDPGTRAAAVTQAEAGLEQAQSAYEANAALRKKGLAAANSGLQLESALKAAQAALDNAKAELARTEIHAKISGVVQEPLADVGSMLGPGAPCATIVQLDPILFAGSVPEARIGYAKIGLKAKVVTVTGHTLEGEVSYISAVADPATRSFAVEITLPNADLAVRDGVTAEATVDVGTAPAHLLPQSVLTLDDDGGIGVRAVVDEKVVFYPVTILRDTREGIWVAGLPPKVDVITVGQEFVTAGQAVVAGYGPEETPAEAAGTAS
jgi:multidrug efflux system membrane fusion protein